MSTHRYRRTPWLVTLAAVTALALAACGSPGMSDDEVAAIRDQLHAVEQRLDEVHALLVSARSELDAEAVEVIGEAQRGLGDGMDALSNVLAELAPPPPPPAADPLPGEAPNPGAPAF